MFWAKLLIPGAVRVADPVRPKKSSPVEMQTIIQLTGILLANLR